DLDAEALVQVRDELDRLERGQHAVADEVRRVGQGHARGDAVATPAANGISNVLGLASRHARSPWFGPPGRRGAGSFGVRGRGSGSMDPEARLPVALIVGPVPRLARDRIRL